MLPVPATGLGRIELPLLPPTPSGPNPTAPGQFSRLYDHMLNDDDRQGARPALPTSMEVRPVLAPAESLATPWVASKEFPTAVDPDGLRVPGAAKAADAGDAPQGPMQFLEPFKATMAETNRLAQASEALQNEAATGGDVDLHDVMIAGEKANLALQVTLQVRNKLVEAYQDVMRMQV